MHRGSITQSPSARGGFLPWEWRHLGFIPLLCKRHDSPLGRFACRCVLTHLSSLRA